MDSLYKENKINVNIYNSVFGNIPCCSLKVMEKKARELVEALEKSAGEKNVLFFRDDNGFPWVALSMSHFVFYEWGNQKLNLFFS